jgi:hypothetical protein
MRASEDEDICEEGGTMKRAKLWAAREGRSYERLRSDRAEQRPRLITASSVTTRPLACCPPILYFPANQFLFRVDPHSSWEAGYTREMARQEQVFLAPRCNRDPSVFLSSVLDST